jgi:hypothetical protein
MQPRRKWAEANPVEAVDLPPKETVTEIRFLTERSTAGELIALRWSDVDWTGQRVRVRRGHTLGQFDTPKSRRAARSVPMSGRVVKALDAWQQATVWGGDDDLVFADPHTGDVLLRGALMRRYRRALKAAQLEPTFRFHDLRHSFGTAMAGAGVPIRTLMAWMGYEDMQTTLIYADYAPNPAEVDMVDRALPAQMRCVTRCWPRRSLIVMFDWLRLRIGGLASRYGDAAAPVCCGACKPCVTTAATGVAVGFAGLAVEAVRGRSRDAIRDANTSESTVIQGDSGSATAG